MKHSPYGFGVCSSPQRWSKGDLTYAKESWGSGTHYSVRRWTSNSTYDIVAHVSDRWMAKALGAVNERS